MRIPLSTLFGSGSPNFQKKTFSTTYQNQIKIQNDMLRPGIKADQFICTKQRQPNFTGKYELAEAHRGSGTKHDPERYSQTDFAGEYLYSHNAEKEYGLTRNDKQLFRQLQIAEDQARTRLDQAWQAGNAQAGYNAQRAYENVAQQLNDFEANVINTATPAPVV